jgi:hypothetical protein
MCEYMFIKYVSKCETNCIAVEPSNIYVVERGNNRVQVFAPFNNSVHYCIFSHSHTITPSSVPVTEVLIKPVD